MKFKGQTNYDHKGTKPKKGVLLINLGTPDEPTPKALRRYLKEFLSDHRVVEIPRLIWMAILHLFILPLRPKNSAKLYASVWTDEGSPLMAITQKQTHKLQKNLNEQYGEDQIPVVMGMRYGNPSIKKALAELADKNVRDITVLPLYPQYCAATTGSTFDAITKELTNYRWVPSLRFINGYHQSSAYIEAISQTIRDYIKESGMPERLIFSYHGTPKRYLEQGDPYFCFCMQTTRLVTESLQLDELSIITSFQSRFGKAEWLQPYTEEKLKSLPNEGVKHVAVICPGFSSDCLETIEEIEVENKEYFIEAGGEQYDYIPCLNDSDDHIKMMRELIVD
ncbi:ferrochelatase [Neptuniibacter sp. UBA6509]|uniref:ferrochelatase n=1 Tax=Neptuniibacter sp. UBA6509 TaxID=1946976 RepID=UPI0025EB3213|nr:ferrochelatase [Neptuniibacter sp. UBA6509]|tara:strand:- start:47 stop:1057 length:1011 start_codon:yes stop_codon:yes gene_type:complete